MPTVPKRRGTDDNNLTISLTFTDPANAPAVEQMIDRLLNRPRSVTNNNQLSNVTDLKTAGASRQRVAHQLSPDQEAGIALIEAFITNPPPKAGGLAPVLTIHGLAGTGKSHLLVTTAKRHPGIQVCAPTNVVAKTLEKKLGRYVPTLYRAFFKVKKQDDDADDKLEFIKQFGVYKSVVLLDECMRVGSELVQDMRASCDLLIAFGDPGQVEPIGGEPYFTKADHTLTVNHRQQAGCGIVTEALKVRQGLPYASNGNCRVVDLATDEMLLGADIVLTRTNDARRAVNARVRQLRGYTGDIIRKGELVMATETAVNKGQILVANSEVFTVAKDWQKSGDARNPTMGRISLVDGPQGLWACVNGISEPPAQKGQWYGTFDFAYCATVEKVQGSEFPTVLLIDDFNWMDQEGYRRWLYTGMTRAQDNLTIARRFQ